MMLVTASIAAPSCCPRRAVRRDESHAAHRVGDGEHRLRSAARAPDRVRGGPVRGGAMSGVTSAYRRVPESAAGRHDDRFEVGATVRDAAPALVPREWTRPALAEDARSLPRPRVELMLQQTQVSRVVTVVRRVPRHLSTLHHVALARPEAGDGGGLDLGTTRVAGNLPRGAPGDRPRARALAMLPADATSAGGRCRASARTAGAVSSFPAYERRAELVDTNVARVIKRVFAPDADLKSGRDQKRIWAIARAAAAHRRRDVDPQPGDDGARRAGVYGAGRAMRCLSGEDGVRVEL